MKRRVAIVAIILTLLMLATSVAFAGSGDLKIVGTNPEDESKGLQPANVAIKIEFDKDMSSETNDAKNAALIQILDSEGKAQEFQLAHHEKYPTQLWCILKADLVANSEYKVVIKSGITSTDGSTTSTEKTFTFKTRNTKTDSTISLVLTFGMMAIMIFATTRSTKNKQQNAEAKSKNAGKEALANSNPYRLAKEQGISVDEAKALIEKEQSKLNKKNASTLKAKEKLDAQNAAKEAEIQRRLEAAIEASIYKMKTKGSMLEHGCKIPKALAKRNSKKKTGKK